MTDQGDGSSSPAQDLIAGAALGLLVGLLIGMTTSSVVGSVVGSLIALIVAVVGLNKETSVIFSAASALRLAAFSVVATLAVLGGVAIRTHDLLSPSPKTIFLELKDAGFPEGEALALVRFRRFGLLPAGAQAAVPENLTVKSDLSTLFSNSSDHCNDLHRDLNLSVPERIARLEQYGGSFAFVADKLKALPDDRRAKLLDAVEFYVCGN